MPGYADFEVGDFLRDDSFTRWVVKNRPDDTAFWETWLQENTDRRDIVFEARQLIENLNLAHENISDEELTQELNKLYRLRTGKKRLPVPEYRRGIWKKWYAAASVFLFLTTGLFLYYQFSEKPRKTEALTYENHRAFDKSGQQWTEFINDETDTKVVLLPDGSSVQVFPGSRIRFPEAFQGRSREVFLKGAAFFDVTPNPGRPFMVYANELVTKVLGTSFTVMAFENDKNIQIIVKTGKVSVASIPDGRVANAVTNDGKHEDKAFDPGTSLILTANQQLIFNREKLHSTRSLIDRPEPVRHEELSSEVEIIYERTPIGEVFASLQKMYEIPILYDADMLSGCQLTAELGNEPFFEKLMLICRAIDASYEVKDGKIEIKGRKCQ